MKKDIQEFTGYKLEGEVLYSPSGNIVKKIVRTNGTEVFKLKNAQGAWCQLSLARLKALAGDILQLPKDARKIPLNNSYFVTKDGKVFSFSRVNPAGVQLNEHISTKGYREVKIELNGKREYVGIHILIAITFLDKDYQEKGLRCMFIDGNRDNLNLSNLKVTSSTEINKFAYKTGANPGNGLKKVS